MPQKAASAKARGDEHLKDKGTSSVLTTVKGSAEFICACEELMRSACKGLPFYKEHEGRPFCVLHYPGREKREDFEKVLLQKIATKDFNFRGVWFPSSVDFSEFDFTDDVTFNAAVFSADAYFPTATFRGSADFTSSIFKSTAYFNGATFNAADFSSATFNSVDFISTVFSAYAYFISASFEGDVDFTSAIFWAETSFRSSTFKGVVLFVRSTFREGAAAYFTLARLGNVVKIQECNLESRLPFDLGGAILEKPQLTTFQSVMLHPHWFINVDPRKINFVDIAWSGLSRRKIISELKLLRERQVLEPHRLLAIAYRQLAVNAEDNNRYSEAADFRYAAMLTRSLEIRRAFRIPPLRQVPRQVREAWLTLDPLHSVYGLASGYGESVGRAFIVLMIIWLCFAAGYWLGDASWWQQKTPQYSVAQVPGLQANKSRPIQLSKLSFGDALIYSSEVITLRKPEPQPASGLARAIILMEAILGPLQVALLALAVRRKFMR